ncbi:MgtC/SapB family protein, partial [Microbispora bryophytorum]|uniref:MgtC/SapB family protein n=4 Tax=Bacillati TaxID=1783272 RepID=UPI0011674E2E
GFLGAGVILRKENDSISGLTTAAIIWGAAGIGIAVGAGFYPEAITGVVLLIISVELLPFLITILGPRQLREKELILQLKLADKHNIFDTTNSIREKNITIKNIRIKDLDTNELYIRMKVSVNNQRPTT